MKVHIPWLLSGLVLVSFLIHKPGSTHSTKANSNMTLIKTVGECRPTWLHKPFSLLELRQIKQDLGSYTDDPAKCIDTFKYITLASDLTWKDIMVIFSQILFDPEHQFNSVTQLCLMFCDPINHSMPGLPVHHQLPESTQTHVH